MPPPLAMPLAGYYDEFLHRTVERLEHLVGRPDDMARLTAQSLSQTLFLHFFREFTGLPFTPMRKRPSLRLTSQDERLVRDYIEAHLAESITLAELAALIRMKPHNFLESFRPSFGNTPAQYVIEQRLRRARWLLQTTRLDITRIALETGFSSHAHLTTVFKNRLGATPKDFRASHRATT